MDKATPTPSPASADSVMAKAMMLVGALDDSCEEATSLPFLEAVTALRAEVERLAAQAAPTEADQLMGMNEAEIDAELLAAGISPDDAVKRADRAIKGALATIRAERRAIEYGDIVHKQVVAMRAAVVAAKLESPEVGIQWIANTLFGPGHYPDIEAARELGGAQAMFDKEMAEHEAFRAAHPAPVAAQPSQAPVVQAVPENCGTGYCSCIECVVEPEAVQTEVRFKYESMKPIDGYDAIYAEYATTFGRYPDDFMSKVVRQTKEDLFMWWGAHREKIRAGLVLLAAQEDASSGATTQAVRMLTPEDEFEYCWLVELFHPGGNSMGFYHTGFTNLHGDSRTTKNPQLARRYESKERAELEVKSLMSLSGFWKAVEHGFTKTRHVAGRTIPPSGEIAAKSPLICPRCKVDRLKDDCPGPRDSCPIKFDAQSGGAA